MRQKVVDQMDRCVSTSDGVSSFIDGLRYQGLLVESIAPHLKSNSFTRTV